MVRLGVGACLAVGLWGCGGEMLPGDAGVDGGEVRVQVTGSVQGAPLVVRSAIAQVAQARLPNDQGVLEDWNVLVVRLSEGATACNPAGGFGLVGPGERAVDLVLRRSAADGPLGPGVFAADAEVLAVPGASCPTALQTSRGAVHEATLVAFGEAQVTLTSLSPAEGTFTVALQSGGSLTGRFTAEPCTFWDDEVPRFVNCQSR